MILSRPVKPRASRMTLMQASVPLLVMRTFWTLGTSSQIRLAMVSSKRIGNAKAGAVLGGGFHGGDDFGMRVSQNGRAPRQHVINQFIAVHVPDVRAAGPVDEERLAADRAEGAHGRIDAAGDVFQRLGKQRFRLGAIHAHKLAVKAPGNKANN